jgi:tRNA(fMet)-specific endonuclease VapC
MKAMYLLDTDHISLLDRGGPEAQNIRARLSALSVGEVAVSIVSYEEQMRGWLAHIARLRGVDRQITGYLKLEQMLRYYCDTPLLPFDDRVLEQFQRLWVARLRIGTMDLKIAATALANDATLVTRNLTDFGKVPGLRLEDWSS